MQLLPTFVAAVLLSTFSIDGALAGITRDDLQILPGQKPADGSKDVYLGARFENSKQTPYFTSLDANISKEDTYWVRVEIFEKTKIYTIRSTKMNMCLVNMSPNVTMQGCMAKYDNQKWTFEAENKATSTGRYRIVPVMFNTGPKNPQLCLEKNDLHLKLAVCNNNESQYFRLNIL